MNLFPPHLLGLKDQLGLCLYVPLLIVSGAHVGAVEVSVGAHLMMQGLLMFVTVINSFC